MGDAEDEAEQLEGDRKTVEALIAHGDPLKRARQVDHWIYFPNPEGRDAFVDEVEPLGFTADTYDAGVEPNPHCARVSRVDHVDLEFIHKVVMALVAAAKRQAGDYDGWECPVETD